jgi:hypothetical protein
MKLAPLVLIVAAAATLPATAQNLKPGLWDTTSKVQSARGEMAEMMAQMQKQMATIPPEQRKAIEGMVARQGGTMPSFSADGGMTTSACMTQEMIDNKEWMSQQTHGKCTQQNSPIVGDAMTIRFSCTDPVANGEARFRFTGGTAYNMVMNTTGVVNGKNETVTVESSGRWLGANCGNIKPRTTPAAKQ